MTVREIDLDAHNFCHGLAEAERVLDSSIDSGQRLVCSTRFGRDSAVFLHLVTNHQPGVPVIWVDTGYDTRATRAWARQLTARFALDLHIFRPREQTLRIPPRPDDPDHASFVEAIKLEPFRRALEALGVGIWLTSVRRYQSPHRQGLELFSPTVDGRTKAHPMLNWSESTVERYRQAHDLPLGPDAYDPAKGDAMRECGLHTMHDLAEVG